MATTSTMELSTVDTTHQHQHEALSPPDMLTAFTAEDAIAGAAHSLPPVDGGKQAWFFLAACFVLEGTVWGLPFSSGVFQVYYTTHQPFASQSPGIIAAIGTTTTGLAFFSCAFLSIALQRWPHSRRPGMVIGLAIMAAGLLGASFCNTATGLLATQGVLYAVGAMLLYFPTNLFLDEWFVKRRGLAFGIMWAGSGTAGIAAPFILKWLLNSYGFRTALRVWAVAMVLLALPCLVYVQPRLPVTSANALRPQDLGFIRSASFWLFQTGNIGTSLGCFLPSLWMPAFAARMGLPAYAGPLSIAFYNGGYSIGAITLGTIADHLHVSTTILISSLGGVVAAFVFWGFANNQPMLYIFAILWGVSSGGLLASWPASAGAIRRIQARRNRNVDTGIYISFMAAGKGIGNVVSGPLSEKLLDLGWNTGGEFAYGTSYGILVIFCGISAAFGGTAYVGRLLKII